MEAQTLKLQVRVGGLLESRSTSCAISGSENAPMSRNDNFPAPFSSIVNVMELKEESHLSQLSARLENCFLTSFMKSFSLEWKLVMSFCI